MTKKNETAVTKKGETAISTNFAINLDEMSNDAHDSGSDFSADDMAIPFLTILQSMSPQLKGSTKIPGAEEGMIFNTVSQELCGNVIEVVPVAYRKKYVAWKTRENGGGFMGTFDTDKEYNQCIKDEKGRDIHPERGDQIVPTAYYYVIMIKEDGIERAVIGMKSTQLKKSRKWNTLINGIMLTNSKGVPFNPPIYSHVYTLSTIEESKEGYSWMNWEARIKAPVQDVFIYNLAKQFRNEVILDNVKTAENTLSPDADVQDAEVAEEELW